MLIAASPSRKGKGAFLLTGRGAEQHTNGTDTVQAAINLALLLGLPGRHGSGYGCLTGQGNGQGGREHGQKADQLPGYQSITDPRARARVAKVWGIDPESLPGPGLPAMELLGRCGTPGGPRALFVHGSNLLVSAPGLDAVRQRLASLDLLVVSDFVLSETARIADVVLPVPQWAEEEGTMTNLEGRVLRRRRAIAAPAGVRDELRIWHDLAERLGCPVTFRVEPAEVFDELARASAGGVADYSGLSHRRLDTGEPLYWPCPADTTDAPPGTPHPGTPRPMLARFATANGRAKMIPAERPEAEPEDGLQLLTGRVLQHYQSGAQTRRVPELSRAEPEPFVAVHPLTAARLDLEEGAEITVTSARGSATGRARFSEDIGLGQVFMPFHWSGDGAVNNVTSPRTDPISGMPEFKVCTVEVHQPRAVAGAGVVSGVVSGVVVPGDEEAIR